MKIIMVTEKQLTRFSLFPIAIDLKIVYINYDHFEWHSNCIHSPDTMT